MSSGLNLHSSATIVVLTFGIVLCYNPIEVAPISMCRVDILEFLPLYFESEVVPKGPHEFGGQGERFIGGLYRQKNVSGVGLICVDVLRLDLWLESRLRFGECTRLANAWGQLRGSYVYVECWAYDDAD